MLLQGCYKPCHELYNLLHATKQYHPSHIVWNYTAMYILLYQVLHFNNTEVCHCTLLL